MSTPSVYNSTSMRFKASPETHLQMLLEQAGQGVDTAFTELYDLFFEKIYRFTYFRVGHKEVAEDLSEDVFIKAFKNLGTLKKTQSFESWLYQIARNKIIDYYRAKKQVIPLDEIEHTLEYETNVVDIVSLEAQQKIFVKLLKELTDEQQTVIKLKFLEDMDNSTIAEHMNKTEGAIRVIQHRAISRLKELIESFTKK
jgi:RNA polymerase sigma-70 factor, ECF subfamily